MKSRFLGMAIAAVVTLDASFAVAAPMPLALWDFETESGTPLAAGSTASRSFDESTAADVFDTGLTADDLPGFGGADPFTIFATFQVDGSHTGGQYDTIFDYSPGSGGTAGADIRLYAQSNGNVRVEASNGAGSEVSLGGVNVYDGQPHTIALIAGGGENFNDLDIYLDGTVYTNPLNAGNNAPMNLFGAGSNVRIGVDHRTFENRHFGGLIDDVAIFGSALSLADLNDLRANGVPAVPEPTTLVLCLVAATTLRCSRGK